MADNATLKITVDAAQAQQALRSLQQSLGGLSSVKPSADFNGLTAGIGGATAAIAGLIAAVAAVGVAFKKGLDINAEVETARLGIKSLVAALTDVKDATGKTATGKEQLDIAGRIADEQVKKLRVAGLETAASFQQLLGAFQQGIGAGSGAGLKLDEIRELTVGIVQAAGAIGVPMEQLNQEVRSLLAGDISSDSTVAKALGITNTQVKEWREAGKLADELNKKLEVFKRLGPETAKTWTATLANLQEGASLFLGTMTEGAFDRLKKSLQGALSGLFKEGTTDLSTDFSGLQKAGAEAFTAIGDGLATALEAGVGLAKDLSKWFDTHRKTVSDIRDAAGGVWDVLKSIATAVASVVAATVKWGVESGFVTGLLRDAALLLAAITDGFQTMRSYVLEFGAAWIDNMSTPFKEFLGLIRDALSLLPGVGPALSDAFGKLVDQVKEGGAKLREEAVNIRTQILSGNGAVDQMKRRFREQDSKKPEALTAKVDEPAKTNGTSTPRKAPDDKSAADAEKQRRAQQALLSAEADAAKKRAQALREVEAAALDYQLAQQLTTYTKYLDSKAALDKKAIDDEIGAQKAKLAQLNSDLASEKDGAGIKRLKADMVKSEAELDALGQRKVVIDAKLQLDKLEFQRDVDSLRVDIKANILDAEGNTLEAGLLKLQRDTEALLRDKRVSGNADLEELVRRQSAGREKRLRFDEANTKVGLEGSRLSSSEDEINRQIQAGQLSQLEGERQIRTARLASASAMRASVDEAKRLAAETKDPALIQAAAELDQKYQALAGTLDSVAVTLNETFFGAIKQGFQDLISGAKSFGDVVKNIISSVLSKLADLALDQALGSLSRGLGGAGGGFGGLISSGLSFLGFAGGGSVEGPGTGTSDSIFARLSNGEFVLRAAAVRALGLNRLNFMNQFGKMPAFASGGAVGGAGGGLAGALGSLAPSAVNANVSVSPRVVISAGHLIEALRNEPSLHRAVLDIVGENGRSIRSAWGN